MLEPIRLVIWDLDETFWHGTIVEGGVDESQHCAEIVKELVSRGIMNSICSKNNFDDAKEILERIGIWNYFVFPSINWEPKGARIKSIIDKFKLRSSSILFIDDNHMNRKEAEIFSPGIQIEDEKFTKKILNDYRFKGKPDPFQKRLNDYKLLEAKNNSLESYSGDTEDFLRGSEIFVEIDYDISSNIDRAIELINRTNQLNFTKKRLSENIEEARLELTEQINHPDRHAGLVKVYDKYGDYGIIGFFLQAKGAGYNKLEHFCFSCRTLGMLIELWLYRKLGSPSFILSGEVLTQLVKNDKKIDWINDKKNNNKKQYFEKKPENTILLCGGCDLQSVEHYVINSYKKTIIHVNTARNGSEIRRDHSSLVKRSFGNLDNDDFLFLSQVGYEIEDFYIDNDIHGIDIAIFSFWSDMFYPLYEVVGRGYDMPFSPLSLGHSNIENIYEIELWNRGANEHCVRNFRFAKANLKHIGISTENIFKENVKDICKKFSDKTKIFLVNPIMNIPHDFMWVEPFHKNLIKWQQDLEKTIENVKLIEMDNFLSNKSDAISSTHFKRQVYLNFGDYINNIIK